MDVALRTELHLGNDILAVRLEGLTILERRGVTKGNAWRERLTVISEEAGAQLTAMMGPIREELEHLDREAEAQHQRNRTLGQENPPPSGAMT